MPGTSQKNSVFGAKGIDTGACMHLICHRKPAVDFIEFLEHIVSHYATGKIHIILDNFNVHKVRSVQGWLANHPRAKLYSLP